MFETVSVVSVYLTPPTKNPKKKKKTRSVMSFNDRSQIFFFPLTLMFAHDCLNLRMELIVCQQRGVNLIAIARMRINIDKIDFVIFFIG